MKPENEHLLSEKEINEYSEELDDLFQSLLPLLPVAQPKELLRDKKDLSRQNPVV